MFKIVAKMFSKPKVRSRGFRLTLRGEEFKNSRKISRSFFSFL